MSSLRPSAFAQRNREDGGPFLLIQPIDLEEGVDVYFTDTPPEEHTSETKIAKLMNVKTDHLTIWPLDVRQDSDKYLTPKYETLERIIINRPIYEAYELPKSEDDILVILEQLPDGFAKDYRFGLGVLYEYRYICHAIEDEESVSALWLVGGDMVKIDPPFFILGIKRFQSIRRNLNRITSRFQREARGDKIYETYTGLLHAADPDKFPKKEKKMRSGALAEKTNCGKDKLSLGPQDRRAVVQLVKDNVEALARTDAGTLMALKSDIELVTLEELIERFSQMIERKLTETKWQEFLTNNPFILSLAFAVPAYLVQGQAYVGGKRISGREGKYADFVYASASTGNLALIEIKRPDTELLSKKPYRGSDVYAASSDFSGAITQLLDQRYNMQIKLPILKMDSQMKDTQGYAIRCILIAGMSPNVEDHRKSFELLRNSLTEVTVITFNELLQRLKEIKIALSHAKNSLE
nr:Shedu immune nuclease family protein [Pantoea stewartii]